MSLTCIWLVDLAILPQITSSSENAQVVTDLQIICIKSVHKLLLNCVRISCSKYVGNLIPRVFAHVETNLEQLVDNLRQAVPTQLVSVVCLQVDVYKFCVFIYTCNINQKCDEKQTIPRLFNNFFIILEDIIKLVLLTTARPTATPSASISPEET